MQFTKTIIACAITALSVGATTSQANFNNFVEDATVSGKLRTVYIDADKKDGGGDAGAWTASATVDFRSGYIYDILGFDASYYGVYALDDGDTNDAKNLLPYGSKQDFSKLGQAYLKGKLGDKNMGASFKAGRTRIYTGLISGSGSRSIPSAWQGIDTDFNYQGLNVGVAWVNAVLPRDTPDMKWMETNGGDRIKHIIGGEASYKFSNGVKLKYTNGYAKDYVKGHQFVAKHTYTMGDSSSLTTEGNYRISQENGDLWNGIGGWGGNGFDSKAETFDFNMKYDMGALYVRGGLGYTKADTYQQGGEYKTARHYYDFGKYSYGAWNSWSTSGLIEEFYWDGETVIALGAGYDFADMGVPGLTIDYKFRRGSSINVVNAATGSTASDAKETEHGVDLNYKFQGVKGLSTRVRYAVYNQEDVPGETDENQLRVYVDYKF